MESRKKSKLAIKSVRNLRTLALMLDGRRIRTPAGALMELSSLANERGRLQQELERLQHRQEEINARLAEIANKENRLQVFLQNPITVPAAPPLAVADTPRGVHLRELNY